MGKNKKILWRILGGQADTNLTFLDVRRLLISLSFLERIRGDHHIYYRKDVEEILNLQPRNHMAKPYQVKQVRNLILKYQLGDLSE